MKASQVGKKSNKIVREYKDEFNYEQQDHEKSKIIHGLSLSYRIERILQDSKEWLEVRISRVDYELVALFSWNKFHHVYEPVRVTKVN
jgi:hypothetical protein